MITRQVRLQLIAFAIIASLGLIYAGGRYAGLGRFVPGYDPGYLVTVNFADSGGVFEGAQVTYRGVPVGKVEKLELPFDKATNTAGAGVNVLLRIKPGTKIPVPSAPSSDPSKPNAPYARVANRSAVGEQYVDLAPLATGAPYLRKGDVIPVEDTQIPLQPSQLILHLDDTIRSVDTADVTTVLDELGTAFDGAGDDLQRLIDASDQLTTTATQYLPQTQKLITDSKPVLDTQRATASDFKSYNASLAQLTTQLRASDPDFRTLFKTGTDSAKVTTDLLEANRANLPILLNNLVFTAQVQAVRIPAIRQILVSYPNVVAGGFTVTPGDGTAHFGFVTDMNSPVCPGDDPGYRTPERDPSDVSVKPANTKAYCSLGSGTTYRGSDYSPRAEGLKPYPADRSQAVNQPSSAQSSLFGGYTGTNDYQTSLADYDPTTGHAITADGKAYTLDSTAGAQTYFGDASWEWLLMNPLRRG